MAKYWFNIKVVFISAFVLYIISFSLVMAQDNSLIYYKLVAQFSNALRTNCPQSALCTLEKLKKEFSEKKETEIKKLEDRFVSAFNPVEYFMDFEKNESTFFTAMAFAQSNRDYEIMSSLLKDGREFCKSSQDYDNYVRSIERWGEKRPKYIISSKKTKNQIYFTFPDIHNESISPNGMYKCLWRENTSGQNRLYFVSERGIEYMIDEWLYKAEILWSPNAKYVALKLNYGENITRIWVVDVNEPSRILKIENLPQMQEIEKKYGMLTYGFTSWADGPSLFMSLDNYVSVGQPKFVKYLILTRGSKWKLRQFDNYNDYLRAATEEP